MTRIVPASPGALTCPNTCSCFRTYVRRIVPACSARSTTSARPLAEITFCVLDLETTGASAESCGITEIGAVQGARRRVPRHVPHPREPGRGHPARDHGAHRHHPGDGASRRRGSRPCCRRARRVHGRRRASSATTCASTCRSSTPPSSATAGPASANPHRRHVRAGPPARARRGAELPARHPRQPVPPRPPAHPPGPRRRPRHHRPAPPAARAGRRRSGCSASTTCSALPRLGGHPAGRQAAPHHRAAAHARASTCSSTAGARCSTSARPPTCASGCAPTSPATTAARSARCCARPTTSTTSAAPPRSRRRSPRSASSTSTSPATTAWPSAWRSYAYLKLTLDEAFPRLSVVRARAPRRRPLPRPAAVGRQRRGSWPRR